MTVFIAIFHTPRCATRLNAGDKYKLLVVFRAAIIYDRAARVIPSRFSSFSLDLPRHRDKYRGISQ